MPDPFRLRVQVALGAKLEEITTTLDALSMAGRVFRGRTVFGPEDPLPMISILEEPIQEDSVESPTTGPEVLTRYRLMIQGFVADDPINPTDPAHYLMADVLAKLWEIKESGGETQRLFAFGPKANTVTGIDFGPGVVRPPDGEISEKAYFWLSVSFDLAERLDDPFA